VTDPARITAPAGLKEMNDELLAQQAAGTLGFDLPVLTITGRRSGLPRLTPLTVASVNGARYVVGGFPGADWIRNARSAGEGTLTIGDVVERVTIVEVDVDEAVPVLRAWPEHTPTGVGMMRDAGVIDDVTPDALAAVAGICPVFRLEAM
jgi:deazaflavin-dependent oxidoreductase (nitroreductase family)